jgi:hypothetical protein
MVKIRNSSNLIKILKDDDGNCVSDMQQIKFLAINFYQNLLGTSSHVFSLEKANRMSRLFTKKFSAASIAGMNAMVTRSEIQKVLFSMKKNKAPGPDGFSASFFHKAWPIIQHDVCDAVLEFSLQANFLERLILPF